MREGKWHIRKLRGVWQLVLRSGNALTVVETGDPISLLKEKQNVGIR